MRWCEVVVLAFLLWVFGTVAGRGCVPSVGVGCGFPSFIWKVRVTVLRGFLVRNFCGTVFVLCGLVDGYCCGVRGLLLRSVGDWFVAVGLFAGEGCGLVSSFIWKVRGGYTVGFAG